MAVFIDQYGDVDSVEAVFLFFELFDFHVHGVGQLFAEVAEQFFAHDFGGEETAGTVGHHFFRIHRHALGQVRSEAREQVGDAQSVFGADGFMSCKFEFCADLVDKFLQTAAARFVFVDFVDDEDDGRVCRQLFHHDAVGIGKAHGFDDENDGIDAAQRFGDVLIEAVVQGVAVFGLEAGRIDENELGGVVGVNAGNAVARGLGFFTGNADFLPDEVIHQRGFADVGAADNGDEAAAVVGGVVGFVLQEGFDVHDGFLFDVSDDLFVLS